MSKRSVLSLSVCALTTAAASAGSPDLPVLVFEVVDNGGISDSSGQNLVGTTTVDVFFHNTGASSLAIAGFDFGAAGPGQTRRINVTPSASLFNHPTGGDTRTPAWEGLFPTVAFDSFWVIGDQTVVFDGSVDLSGADGDVNARFRLDGGASVNLLAGGELRVARLTFLEGDIDLSLPREFAVILSDGSEIVYLPAPGAATVLGLGGLVALRRRR